MRWRHLMNSIILINVDKYSFLLVQFLALLCVSFPLVGDEPKQIFGKTFLFMHQAKNKNCLYLESDRSVMEEEEIQMFVLTFSLLRVEKILKNDIVKDILCRLKLK